MWRGRCSRCWSSRRSLSESIEREAQVCERRERAGDESVRL